MFDRTIPPMIHGLTALKFILAKTEAHCAEKRIDPGALLAARLYPDMLPFVRQVQLASDHARRSPARLLGLEPTSVADTETSFADLIDRLRSTIETMKGFDPEAFDHSEHRRVQIMAGTRELDFDGATYVGLFVLPNFYFHLTTAYNILRHNGVPLGKTDFLGG